MMDKTMSNNENACGFAVVSIVVFVIGAAFLLAIRNDLPTVGPELETVQIEHLEGVMVSSLICFRKEDGQILWRKNVPMIDRDNHWYASTLAVPSIDDKMELVAGLGRADGEKAVCFFKRDGGCLLLAENYEPKGSIVGAMNQFLLGP